jgi:hypothetical protein
MKLNDVKQDKLSDIYKAQRNKLQHCVSALWAVEEVVCSSCFTDRHCLLLDRISSNIQCILKQG